MVKIISRALIMIILFTLLTGIAYPLAVTGLAQILFPVQANGSMVKGDNQPVGSALIGQSFSSPKYFHGRPSAAGKQGYDAAASAGSNLGPTNKALIANVSEQVEKIRNENRLSTNGKVPSDLVTASASGLDPHISPQAALVQVSRIAKSRGLTEATLTDLVSRSTTDRQFGVLGEPRVNVLQLNLALDQLK